VLDEVDSSEVDVLFAKSIENSLPGGSDGS
jgi:hypothetical protein